MVKYAPLALSTVGCVLLDLTHGKGLPITGGFLVLAGVFWLLWRGFTSDD